PQLLLVDGNRFQPFEDIPHETIVKGDGIFQSIAAASILAKTYRDDYMLSLHKQYPHYHWDENKGYPTKAHREAILQWGVTPHHRRSFNLLGSSRQLTLPLA
ncbi:MAG: ribonuclease HII, partial [Prevotellaceae bacterium]|nr:ribonuclease HII [Prevotellaceae bacterium]